MITQRNKRIGDEESRWNNVNQIHTDSLKRTRTGEKNNMNYADERLYQNSNMFLSIYWKKWSFLDFRRWKCSDKLISLVNYPITFRDDGSVYIYLAVESWFQSQITEVIYSVGWLVLSSGISALLLVISYRNVNIFCTQFYLFLEIKV